jgi:hypothetical protein
MPPPPTDKDAKKKRVKKDKPTPPAFKVIRATPESPIIVTFK